MTPWRWLLGFLFILKLVLMWTFPVFGDEAYYILWGNHLAGGYYDLPPMIGWILSPFLAVLNHPFWLRLPALLAVAVAAWLLYSLFKPLSEVRARWIALGFWVLPLEQLALMVTPDIPLMVFLFASLVVFWKSENRFDRGVISGLLWGAALLSKYFAVLVLPGLLLWWVFFDQRRSVRPLLGFILGVIPAVAQHLWWNHHHCWANFVFNLVTRQRAEDGGVVIAVMQSIGFILIVSFPYFFRWRPTPPESPDLRKFFILTGLGPLLLLFVTAVLGKGQGLHWYWVFIPMIIPVFASVLTTERLEEIFKLNAKTSVFLSLIAVVAISFSEPIRAKILPGHVQFDFEVATRGQELIRILEAQDVDIQAWVTDSYTGVSVLDFQKRRYGKKGPDRTISQMRSSAVGQWGGGSRFGRALDWIFDFSSLNGKSILLFSSAKLSDTAFSHYFDQVEHHSVRLGSVDAWISVGRGFHFDRYFQEVLRPTHELFYPPFKLGPLQLSEGCSDLGMGQWRR